MALPWPARPFAVGERHGNPFHFGRRNIFRDPLLTNIDELMSFDLKFPTPGNGHHRIHVDRGEVLFVLGANELASRA